MLSVYKSEHFVKSKNTKTFTYNGMQWKCKQALTIHLNLNKSKYCLSV